MEVKIVNKSAHPLPSYQTEGSAGMDIMANIPLKDTCVIPPHSSARVPTGLHIELPIGYEAQIRPRSGLAFNRDITVLNSPGTIDSDYRGEIVVILINHGNSPKYIHDGDRIAQMVVAPVTRVDWHETNDLTDTERGTGGFGHTGK